MASAEEVQELKEKGNECVRNKKYAESVFHYTHAIKLDPFNYSIYSNRSLALLKMQQFYFAIEDAKEAIRLKPDWAKGYFRKAEVEFSTFRFSDALISYGHALKLQPNDPSILEAIVKTSKERQKDRRADDQIPWLGAGVGIIMGVIIVIADNILTHKPTLVHPILMALLTVAVAAIGYGVARGLRYYMKCQREALLEPPLDFLRDDKESQSVDTNDTVKEEKTYQSYTKAQARHRFKKGKS
ncbi:STI1-like protein [Zootermopsis nevadensis]|uniref:STI1-like protein n=1 Tax=Zootermopsis nevadensis TaxID=136037 RepID=UPI000B8E80C2|nr:STI1-like protein [Zootermopsis nevadensis]